MTRNTPITYVLIAVLVSALSLTSGCEGKSFLNSGPEGELRITLEVSGGLAGVDYAFSMDGEDGVVLAERCVSGCDFEEGDTLLVLTPRHVEDLAGMIADAGLLQLDREDYGTQCCDQFHYRLQYTDEARQRTVMGSSEALPEDIRNAIATFANLAGGVVPVIVDFNTMMMAWESDSFTLGTVSAQGVLLQLEVTYGGGCGVHSFEAMAWGGWMESYPVQVNVILTHDDRDDPCDALVTDTLRFDLMPLRRRYEQDYPGSGPGETIVLRLTDPDEAPPPGVRVVDYVF